MTGLIYYLFGKGSPPRVRGIVVDDEDHAVLPGITPACAGNSDRLHTITPYKKDHPRVCGE